MKRWSPRSLLRSTGTLPLLITGAALTKTIPYLRAASSSIYQSLITDVFLEKSSKHFSKRIYDNSARYSERPDFLPGPFPLPKSILNRIQHCTSLPNHIFYHHMSLCLNTLATTSRMRHFNGNVAHCYLCGEEEDSLYHIYVRCKTVSSARCLFFSSLPGSTKCDIPHPHHPASSHLCVYLNFPLSHTLLSDSADNLSSSILLFNYAIWRFRLPAAAALPEKGPQWIASHISSIGCSLSKPKRSKSNYKTSHNKNLSALPEDSIICYTDGSASPNPGPCGAGVFICDPLRLQAYDCGAALGQGTNNIGELYALGLCLRRLLSFAGPRRIAIYTDSELACSLVCSSKRPRKNADLTVAVRRVYKRALAKHSIEILWVKGHSDVPGNSRVDKTAKRFAHSPGSLDLDFPGQSLSSHWPHGPHLESLDPSLFDTSPIFPHPRLSPFSLSATRTFS